ncbi:hypothetical protein KEH57_09540 [Burkholderia cenocepacia]|uniref:cadherin-like beta sandwich domain-containing protein n=1 Tax=Burkholderia cenocepacia TaxID=95486 RepID=UPI001BA84770|nr:cadherin-like beta sandwich domain-containing protein [Burkholderia cenocepacia]QUO23833.1 hypothetical protein KEH57_09540 [Burkholderia cenocepacia]
MAYHRLFHGGIGVFNPNWEMYPASPLTPGDGLMPAAHKEDIVFGLTRLLDFSQKDARRQAGLQQFLERAVTNGRPLQQGDVIGLCVVPAKSLFYGYAWEVDHPEAGVTLTLRTHSDGAALTTVNASVADSSGEPFATPKWLHDNEVIDVELTAWPANGVTDLRFSVSPIVFWPRIGN